MRLSFLKPHMPRSLYIRAMLILMIPLVVLQAVVAVVFIQRHFDGVTRQMTRNIAREIAVAQQVIDTSPSAQIAQVRLNNLSKPLGITLELDEEALPSESNRRVWYDLSGRALIFEMEALLGIDLSVDLLTDRKMVDARLLTGKGTLRALIPRSRVSASNPHQLLVLTTLVFLTMAGIALVFLRNQMRPITNLATAAEAFGKGRSVPYVIGGAEEVRRAGTAFLAMRGRIERQIEQRTRMLSGVSHDLRTPLTRMKLTLSMIDAGDETRELKRDLDEMEEMLNAFLDFARDDRAEEMTKVNVIDMVTDLAADARRSGLSLDLEVDTETPDTPTSMLREGAVCRAVQNLLTNAQKFGDQAKLTLRLTPKAVFLIVEDDGPGIDAEHRDYVLRPFTQLDEARNQDRGGGVGLGLSIAQDVARGHGGALELGDSDTLGGLKATLRLPR